MSCSLAATPRAEELRARSSVGPSTSNCTARLSRSSSQHLPVYTHESSSRRSTAWHVPTLIVLVLASLACYTGYQLYYDAGRDPYMDSSQNFVGSPGRSLLKRNYKTRMLEQQIVDRENEIRYLQYQIDRVVGQSKLQETNMAAAETAVVALTQQYDHERTQRSKAQLALAQKAQELQECMAQRDAIAEEVDRCGKEIQRTLSHRYNHLSAGQQQRPGGAF